MTNGFWRRRKVLITGATGFLGSRLLTDLLLREADVSAIIADVDYNNSLFGSIGGGYMRRFVNMGEYTERIYWADMRDADAVKTAIIRSEPEYIFHLAATTQVEEAHIDPLHSFDVNAQGTVRLLEACRQIRRPVKIVVATTDKVYGSTYRGKPFVESDSLDACHPYDAGKVAADVMARSFAYTYGLDVAIVRMANLYGAGDTNWRRLIPGVIRYMLSGETPLIRSDGTQVRQYLYVADAIGAFHKLCAVMDAGVLTRGSVFNIGPRDGHSVAKVVSEIAKRMPEGVEPLEPQILDITKGESPKLMIDSRLAELSLGWEATTSLEEGLDRTIPWYQEYFSDKAGPPDFADRIWEVTNV